MKRVILTILALAAICMSIEASQPLDMCRRANNYFMTKWSDPSWPTTGRNN